jgi:hypothetical protein
MRGVELVGAAGAPRQGERSGGNGSGTAGEDLAAATAARSRQKKESRQTSA